jgi:hypothetical protein
MTLFALSFKVVDMKFEVFTAVKIQIARGLLVRNHLQNYTTSQPTRLDPRIYPSVVIFTSLQAVCLF